MGILAWLYGLLALILVVFAFLGLVVRKYRARVVERECKQEEVKQYGGEAKRKGDEFERYIMRKLSQNRYFTIKEVTADKGFDIGVWVESNANPDFVVEFNWKEKGICELFAVECKWRSNLFQDCFCWASLEQIQRYEKFSSERRIPVFLALGLGGDPGNPKKLYVVPLKSVLEDIKEFRGREQGAIYFKKLNNPKLGYLKLKESGFFFDHEAKILR